MSEASNKLYLNDFDDRISIVVAGRQNRPITRADEPCPFCPGGIEFKNSDTGSCYIFKNRYPAMGNGFCEVVVFSSDHNKNLYDLKVVDIEKIISIWVQSTVNFVKDDSSVKYVLIFENNGAQVGATIHHPHGQIYAFDFIPQVPKDELSEISCNFCTEAEDDLMIIDSKYFQCIEVKAATYPFEMIIKSKDHIVSLIDLNEAQSSGLASILQMSLKALSLVFTKPMPYMLWIHQGPFNDVNQDLGHLHIHICGLYRTEDTIRYVAAGELGSGVMFNPVDPYDAASILKSKLVK